MTKRFYTAGCAILALLLLLPMLFACASTPDLLAKNSVTALYPNDKGELVANVTLEEQTLRDHEGQRVAIYELLPGETVSALSARAPLDESKLRHEISFSFPITDGERTRLYSSFVIGFSDGSFLSEVGTYVGEPERLSTRHEEFLWAQSPKGLSIDSADDALALGCMHGMLSVRFSELFGGTDSFTFGEKSYPISNEVLASLDARVLAADRAGLQVSLTVIPDSLPSFDTAVAAADLLASRYSTAQNGTVSAIFVDAEPLDAETAASLCRIFYTALCSRQSNGRVFILSHTQTVSSTVSFFNSVRDRIAKGGSFAWGAAVAPVTPPFPWNSLGEDALSISKLDALRKELTQANGTDAPSWFALCELRYSAEDQEAQAASFAYAYRLAAETCDLIFYGSHLNDSTGLRNAAGEAHRILSVFSSIDTGLSSADRLLCETHAGKAWEQLDNTYLSRKVVTGVASNKDTAADALLFDFAMGDLYGFTASSHTATTLQQSATWNAPVLYTWLNPTLGRTGGIYRTLNDASVLQDASMLRFRLLTQAPGAESTTVTLTLEGVTENGDRLTYQSQTTMQNGSWQTASFQISNFTVLALQSRPVALSLTVTPDENAADEPYVLWVKDVGVSRVESNTTSYLPAILISAGVVASAVVILLIYRVTTKKRYG